MRLKTVDRGSGLLQRAQYAVIRRFVGHVPGSVSATSYRRNFFGKHFARCVQEALRAQGEWTIDELEILAAFVARLNRCRYCATSHAAVAAKATGQGATVESVLADRRTAPISARLQAVLDLLEKLTLSPEQVGPADVKAARDQGASDAALRQAIYVCFVSSTMGRIADALAFELPDARILKRYAWIATTFGYKKLSLPG